MLLNGDAGSRWCRVWSHGRRPGFQLVLTKMLLSQIRKITVIWNNSQQRKRGLTADWMKNSCIKDRIEGEICTLKNSNNSYGHQIFIFLQDQNCYYLVCRRKWDHKLPVKQLFLLFQMIKPGIIHSVENVDLPCSTSILAGLQHENIFREACIS